MFILFLFVRDPKSSSRAIAEITTFQGICYVPVSARHLILSQTFLCTLYGDFLIFILQPRRDAERLRTSLIATLLSSDRARASNLGLTTKLQNNTTFLGANGHSQSALGVKNTTGIILFLLLVWYEARSAHRTGSL